MLGSLLLANGPFVAAALIFSIFASRSLVLAGGSQLWTARAAWPKSRLVVGPRFLRTDWVRDLRRGMLVLALDASVFALAVHAGLFAVSRSPSAQSTLVTAAAFFVWFEVYFYFSHRALHHPMLFWIHRYHHEGRGTNPWTSLAFSFSERIVLYVGVYTPAILLARVHPVPVDGFGLYFLVNYVLNVNGHMNVEITPAWLRRTPLFAWLSTSTSHSLHHLRFRGNYGLFTQVLDRWLGTYFGDYPEVFDRVVAGQGALAR